MILAGLALVGCDSSGKSQKKGQKDHSALAAQVLTVSLRTATLNKDYPALLRSRQQVRVVARINGILEARYYDEGQHVEKGQKLFSIEQAPYKATVEQRQADLASAKATRHNAQITFNRSARLYKDTNGKGISKQAYDNDRAGLETAKASVQQAEAALDQAQVNLGYTHVTAPVAGQISLRRVNVGNLVNPGDKLATITPLNPIEARFSLPISDATTLRRQRQGQRQGEDPSNVSVVLGSPEETKTLTGHLDFLGSQVNRQTNTVQARATFDNPKELFLPGQFVRVTLQQLRIPNVLAVPQVAVTQGQGGSQLYVLDKHNKARPQQVSLGDTFGHGGQPFGQWVIVRQGLKPGARVVVNHIASVQVGTPIKPQPIDRRDNNGTGGGKPAGKSNAKAGKAGGGR